MRRCSCVLFILLLVNGVNAQEVSAEYYNIGIDEFPSWDLSADMQGNSGFSDRELAMPFSWSLKGNTEIDIGLNHVNPYFSGYRNYQNDNNLFGRIDIYGYDFSDRFHGFNVVGAGKGFKISDNLSVGVNAFTGGSYFGPGRPYRNNFGSLKMDVDIKVSERVTLSTFGQVSTRHAGFGEIRTIPGSGTCYGGSLKVKITDKVGIECGVQREYIMGKWKTFYYASPYFYK